MMRSFGSVVLAALLGVSTGCAFYSAPVVPPVAGVFSNIEAPLDVDMDPTELGTKVGRSSASNILSLISFGDASIAGAAQRGGIQTIRHADYEYFNILGVYQRFTTVVHGD